MEVFVIDTHALAWFFAEDSRLSSSIETLLTQAEATTTQILIPTLVLAELTLIAQKQRVPISPFPKEPLAQSLNAIPSPKKDTRSTYKSQTHPSLAIQPTKTSSSAQTSSLSSKTSKT
ncbi:MAG: hypothetical protein MUC48_04830 [Leptolyngbya sp. Prado105]|nr:hypothetical protein [Leptolyngbya sp. Prado105]